MIKVARSKNERPLSFLAIPHSPFPPGESPTAMAVRISAQPSPSVRCVAGRSWQARHRCQRALPIRHYTIKKAGHIKPAAVLACSYSLSKSTYSPSSICRIPSSMSRISPAVTFTKSGSQAKTILRINSRASSCSLSGKSSTISQISCVIAVIVSTSLINISAGTNIVNKHSLRVHIIKNNPEAADP